jgi:hypothetical protein
MDAKNRSRKRDFRRGTLPPPTLEQCGSLPPITGLSGGEGRLQGIDGEMRQSEGRRNAALHTCSSILSLPALPIRLAPRQQPRPSPANKVRGHHAANQHTQIQCAVHYDAPQIP